MRSKKIFSFNEEKDAEKIIVDGFPNGSIDYNQMYVIAKYFREKFNYGAIRLERELIKFCKAQDKNFNPIIEAGTLKKWVKAALTYSLRKIDGISITKKEIEFLNTVESPKDRKLLFVTLALSKALKTKESASDKFYIHYSNLLDVIRLSKMANLGEVGLADVFFNYKDGLTFYSAEKELIRVDYADCNSEEMLYISDMENMLDYYDLLFGKNKTFCSICGKEFSRKANNQKVCSECATSIRREKQKMLMRERRKNKMEKQKTRDVSKLR